MFYFRFSSSQFNGAEFRHLDDRCLMAFLECLIIQSTIYLEANPEAPLLYDSGVYYRRRVPKCQVDDDWADAGVCLTLKYADCEDAAAWRCAELRIRGIHAVPYVTRQDQRNGGWLYHIRVKLPSGEVEDPSALIDYKGNYKKGRVERG